uniref:METTL17 n=1 Tax=Otolemur garnettii TaxID=30611 RepID=H0XVZ3_OTOGA
MVPLLSSTSPVQGECLHSLLSERPWGSRDSSAPKRSELGSPSAHAFLSAGNQLFFSGLQALAALVPGVTRVDDKTDFLEKLHYRKHPGILKLPHVRLPQALANAAQLLLLESAIPNVEKQVQTLTNYLWSRHLPVESADLQRRAMHLEKKILGTQDEIKPLYGSLYSAETPFRVR